MRDTVAGDALTVVMTDTDPLELRTRLVTGAPEPRPYADRAAEEFDRRGETTAGLVPGTVVIEVAPPRRDDPRRWPPSRTWRSSPRGALVRLALNFDGEAMATCALADGGCGARSLAKGSGVFITSLTTMMSTAASAVLVQLLAPASVVAGQWQGGRVRNEDDLVDFVSSVPVQALAGWGHILVLASIEDDPGIVRDRSWLGPILLGALTFLLWLGGRLGIPIRPMSAADDAGSPPRTGHGGDLTLVIGSAEGHSLEIPLHVSGHAVTTGGQRRNLDQARRDPSLRDRRGRPDDCGSRSRRWCAGPLAAFDTGVLGRVERGEVVPSPESSRPSGPTGMGRTCG